MVTKTSPHGAQYEIDGRKLTWHPEDDDGNRATDLVLPLRIKMRLVLQFSDADLDNEAMNKMVRALIPEQFHDALDDMDVNDFQDMFVTWQNEYNSLTGGSLGESSPSASSSPSTAAPSSTTSDTASTVSA